MSEIKDYYAILGVLPDAEVEVIRAVYLALAKKYHPDSSGSSNHVEKLKDINEAYEILNDPDRRKIYDAAQPEKTDSARGNGPDVEDEDLAADDFQSDWNHTAEYRPILTRILKEIEKPIVGAGFIKEETASGYFTEAYTIRNMVTSAVFLIKIVEDDIVSNMTIKEIVDTGRKWCSINLNATWAVKEAGLNLVFLHKGQINPETMKSQTDKTGLHGSICQSVTAINVSNDVVIQEKTWIVIGKVNKALSNLIHTFLHTRKSNQERISNL